MADFAEGDRVRWRWGQGEGTGVITRRFSADVTLTLKGSEITRRASPDNPAFLIEQEDGDEVLKGLSELHAA